MLRDSEFGSQIAENRESLSDSELLRRYAETRDNEAFTALVHRHVNLVYRAALRQLHGDTHRAEDVAQLVFTTVTRKASALAQHPSLAGWLYTTTHFTVRDVQRAERRRRVHEQEAHRLRTVLLQGSPPTWDRLGAVLDGAIQELSSRDREVIVTRFFKARSYAEIGAQLALTEDAARMRVERALEKLRQLLARRKVTSTAAALAVALANEGGIAAPAGLAVSVAGAALSGAAVGGASTGAIATLLGLIIAGKAVVVLSVVGALTLAVATYQVVQAQAAAASLAAAQSEYAALRVRLASMEARAPVAGPNQPDRASMVTNVTAETGSSRNGRAKSPAAPRASEANQAGQKNALQQFLDNDPELRELRRNEARLKFKAGTGLFLRSIGLTPQQVDQAADYFVDKRRQESSQRELGLESEKPDQSLSTFRAMFGETAAAQFSHWKRTWAATQVVNEMSGELFFTNDPLTRGQAERLAEIITNARIPAAPPNISPQRLAEFVDWDRVEVEVEPILSPAQLQGVRARAALSRLKASPAAMIAAANLGR